MYVSCWRPMPPRCDPAAARGSPASDCLRTLDDARRRPAGPWRSGSDSGGRRRLDGAEVRDGGARAGPARSDRCGAAQTAAGRRSRSRSPSQCGSVRWRPQRRCATGWPSRPSSAARYCCRPNGTRLAADAVLVRISAPGDPETGRGCVATAWARPRQFRGRRRPAACPRARQPCLRDLRRRRLRLLPVGPLRRAAADPPTGTTRSKAPVRFAAETCWPRGDADGGKEAATASPTTRRPRSGVRAVGRFVQSHRPPWSGRRVGVARLSARGRVERVLAARRAGLPGRSAVGGPARSHAGPGPIRAGTARGTGRWGPRRGRGVEQAGAVMTCRPQMALWNHRYPRLTQNLKLSPPWLTPPDVAEKLASNEPGTAVGGRRPADRGTPAKLVRQTVLQVPSDHR